ncbi:methyltransferase domain-containing protein [bacterium]|jgi:ubiquinone/menaquinone biosynthesis C-methylase UbiE|nr:methyltransferase domain-containing protein [bacterium]MBT4122057.1 methyltransferase domain-containing protein [bacterium]MBT4495308.1 methyltransferase domain-containing protein [bacterium]MBT4763661.1 methyltransferase domain-containing protein [bacterium]MBT5401032.1 methyltransferase domain-containing protein [bacterium]
MAEKKIAGGNELLNPAHILKNELEILPKTLVGDLGCGSMGFFTLQAAKLVGDQGKVYAVDILKDVLSAVEGRARQEGLYNIRTVWSNLETVGATNIKEGILDYTLYVNTLFQSKKNKEMLEEAYRLLKEGGKLLVVDWKTATGPIGPTPDTKISSDQVNQKAISLGFRLEKEFDAGENHYGLILVK